MLSIADNLGHALAAIPAELREDERMKSLLTGIEIGKELDNAFQRNGITKIEAVGAKLDPNRHQDDRTVARRGGAGHGDPGCRPAI